MHKSYFSHNTNSGGFSIPPADGLEAQDLPSRTHTISHVSIPTLHMMISHVALLSCCVSIMHVTQKTLSYYRTLYIKKTVEPMTTAAAVVCFCCSVFFVFGRDSERSSSCLSLDDIRSRR